MTKLDRLATVAAGIRGLEAEAFQEGIIEGIVVAKRIAQWYQSNPQLVKPFSEETLAQWTNDAISELAKKEIIFHKK